MTKLRVFKLNNMRIFFQNSSAMITGILIITSFVIPARGQLRTPRGDFFQLQGLSPLNDKSYFKSLVNKYTQKKSKKNTANTHMALTDVSVATPVKSDNQKQILRYKKIELYGLKTIIKPVTTGKKIIAPKQVDLQNPFYKNLNRTIPGNLAPTQNESEVVRRFGDQAIQNWLNSPEVKNSSFGKAASQVESAMKVEASIQSAPISPGADPIDHKFSFQYLALQSQTKVEYKGWTNAFFRVDSSKSETAFEISEKIFKNKDFVLSHVKNPIEDRSSMGLRWNW